MEVRFVADKLEALVAETLAAGGRFTIDDDRVRVSAPAPLPGELLARLRIHKPDLIAWLRSRPVCCECRQPITEPVVAWWGGKPAHAGCGERAWQKAWVAVPTERRGRSDGVRAARCLRRKGGITAPSVLAAATCQIVSFSNGFG